MVPETSGMFQKRRSFWAASFCRWNVQWVSSHVYQWLEEFGLILDLGSFILKLLILGLGSFILKLGKSPYDSLPRESPRLRTLFA